MKVLNYKIKLKRESKGGYTVIVPSLPECNTYGDTIQDALKIVKETIEHYLESSETRKGKISTKKIKLEIIL